MDSKTEWMASALCKQKTELFFPSDEDMGRASVVYKNAKVICKECSVIKECLEYALNEEMYFGVWGGTTPKERQVMLRNRLYSK